MALALGRHDTLQAEFSHRRSRELVADVICVSLMLSAVALLVFSYLGGMTFIYLGIGCWVVAMPGSKFFSRRNWRCPHCGAALWGKEMRIDPLFCPHDIHCMYCDTLLRK